VVRGEVQRSLWNVERVLLIFVDFRSRGIQVDI
jgi:hypothetical protein